MIVSIHQPNYLPWLGFFYKMWRSDRMVLLDNVQYSKNSFQNRNRIKAAGGAVWLSVPVMTAGRLAQSTDSVKIAPGMKWQKNHLQTIRQYYQRAPYFTLYLPELLRVYEQPWVRLLDLNVALIRLMADALQISTPLLFASDLGVEGNGTKLLIDTCHSAGATRYLSGFGGRDYQDPEQMVAAGIQLEVYDFQHPNYPQLWGEFIPQLSALDLILNTGPNAAAILRSSGAKGSVRCGGC